MKRVALMGLLILSVSLLTGVVWAGEVTTTFQVSATVPQAVTVTAYDLDFGTASFSSSTYQTTTIEVTAQNGLQYQIGLDAGQYTVNCPNSSSGRCLAQVYNPQNSTYVWWRYELFQDSSYTTVWGDNCTTSPTLPGSNCSDPFTGTGGTQTYTVYGALNPPSTMIPPGTYTDTITVTVVY